MAADDINLMHQGMKMHNMYVRYADNLDRVELAVSGFGGAQRGEETVRESAKKGSLPPTCGVLVVCDGTDVDGMFICARQVTKNAFYFFC